MDEVAFVTSPARITPCPGNLGFPAEIFLNTPASNVPNNILINPPFCFFDSFLIVLLMPFNSKTRFCKRLNYSYDTIHFFV